MQGKELLKYFRELPEQEQNKILVDAYKQIATLHDSGRSFDSFSWKDCSLDGGKFNINTPVDDYFNEEARQRNILDYAKVIYCLTTGNKSAESMSWDAGRKIQSSVLREIVLTICGRNYTIEPLLKKLRQPYTDDEAFFDGYTTVDEKEGREAAEKRQQIDAENRASDAESQSRPRNNDLTSPRKKWHQGVGVFILMTLLAGGYKACRSEKKIKSQQATKRIEMMHQQRQQFHETLKGVRFDMPYRSRPSGNASND